MAVMYCRGCGHQLSPQALNCSNCGKPMKTSQGNPGKNTWLRNVLIAVGVLFVIGVFASSDAESPAAQAIEVSALDLVLQYDSNEIAADNKFRGKTIKVSGMVEDVGKDIMDTPYVVLGGTGFRAVQCFFSGRDSEPVARVQRGQRIAVQGKCDGLMVNVLINKSKIVP